MKTLPAAVVAYRRTPTFNQDSVPAGLTRDHRTAAGTWGEITVLSGQLRYDIPGSGETHVLEPGSPGIVEPEVPHHVTVAGPVEFYVQFYRAPAESTDG